MKRLLFLLCGFLWMVQGLRAEPITESEARRLAGEFFRQQGRTAAVPLSRMALPRLQNRSLGEEAPLYLFNRTDAPGFVVVAGEDAVSPILGYSFTHPIPSDRPLPENMQAWLEEMERQILWCRERGVTRSEEVTEEGYGEPVVQLTTALWNQDEPYWWACPVYEGYRCFTGCTNTALAIVMRYHSWPERGEGTLEAYTSQYGDYVIDIPGHALGHTYDWENMPLDYRQGYTEEQGWAVAQLMYDCGVMLQAGYSPEGTGTSIYYLIPEMVEHMDYDPSARYVDAANFNLADFQKILKEGLDAGLPVLHTGYNEVAGHAFVLEGYSTTDYFAVNWGWGGYCNGWFRLTALAPEGSGAGGNNDHYSDAQSAIVGLKRNQGGAPPEALLSYSPYMDRDGVYYYGLTAHTDTFKADTPFSLSFGLLTNRTHTPFTGTLALAHTDRDFQVCDLLYSFSTSDLEFGYGYAFTIPEVRLLRTPTYGDRLVFLFQESGSQEWRVVRGNEEQGCTWSLPIAAERPLEEVTSFHYDRTTCTIRLGLEAGYWDNVAFSLYQMTENLVPNIYVGEIVGVEIKEGRACFVIDTNQLEAGSYGFYLFWGETVDSYVLFTIGEPSTSSPIAPASRQGVKEPPTDLIRRPLLSTLQ